MKDEDETTGVEIIESSNCPRCQKPFTYKELPNKKELFRDFQDHLQRVHGDEYVQREQ